MFQKQLKLYFVTGFLFLILGISQCALRNMVLASSTTTEKQGQFAKYKFTQQNVSCSEKEFVKSVSVTYQPAVFLLPEHHCSHHFNLLSNHVRTANLQQHQEIHQSTPALYILFQQLKIAS